MHLVLLTQYFSPETGAPQNRLGDLSRRLHDAGHRITVVTAMPNYPSGSVDPRYRRQVTARDEVDGADVLRSFIYSHRGRGTAHQLAAYGSFVASASLTAPLRIRSADVVLWESPPLFLAPTAEVLALRLGARLVMNVSDLWPESAIELGMLDDPRLIRFFTAMARRAYRRADLVLGQTEGILAGVEAVAPGTPTALYPNGVDCGRFEARPDPTALRTELGIDPSMAVVGYAGNFGRAQALEQVVDAARRLLAARSNVVVALVGDGPVKSSIEAAAAGVGDGRLLVRPSVPAGRVPELVNLFDAAIVPLADQPLFDGARPSKMFELMAAGTPFVFCGRGEGAEIAERSGGAVVVPPEDPEALSEALGVLLDRSPTERELHAARARSFAFDRFDRARIAEDVADRLSALIAQPKATRRRARMRTAARPSP